MPLRAASRFDYAVGICSVWISGGFFLDAWAHGHVPVESFFTPYHARFLLRNARRSRLVIAAFACGTARLGYAWADYRPRPYRLALARHSDLHRRRESAICSGISSWESRRASTRCSARRTKSSAWASSSSRAVRFARCWPTVPPRRSRASCRWCSGLATWLILVHFGTAYAFDPAAGRTNAPPPIAPFNAALLTALSIGYYKISIGVLIVIFQSTVMAGFALWLVSRMRLRSRHADALLPDRQRSGRRRIHEPNAAARGDGRCNRCSPGSSPTFFIARYDPQPERSCARFAGLPSRCR